MSGNTITLRMRCPAIEGYWEVGGNACPLVLTNDRLAQITSDGDIHEIRPDGSTQWIGRVYPPEADGMSKIWLRVGDPADADRIEELVVDALVAFEGNPAAALTRYSKRYDKCEICGKALSNDTSRRLGAGPDCRGRRDVLAAIRQESREWIKQKQEQFRAALRQHTGRKH